MKRRIISIFLILILVWLCSSTNAEEQARLWFDVSGEENAYTVCVQLSENSGIEMLQFCLRYDAEKLELQSVSAGDVFQRTTDPTISANESGRVYLVWDALKPLPGGEMLILRFAARENAAGNASIFFDKDFETIAADGAYREIALQTERLEIAVGNPVSSSPVSSFVPALTSEPIFAPTPEPVLQADITTEQGPTSEPIVSTPVETVQPHTASTDEESERLPEHENENLHSFPTVAVVTGLAVLSAAVAVLTCWRARRKTK